MDTLVIPDFSEFNGVKTSDEFLSKLDIPDGSFAVIDGVRCVLTDGVWLPAGVNE